MTQADPPVPVHPYLQLLRRLSAATDRVLAAARTADWDAAEAGLRQRQELMAAMDVAGQSGLTAAERTAAATFFATIQAADAEAHAALVAAHKEAGGEMARLNQGRQALSGYRRGLVPPSGPQSLDEQG